MASNKRLNDKVSIITGAGSGIGRQTAIRFAKEGSKVVAADRNRRGADETVRLIKETGGEAIAQYVDVGNIEHVSAMVDSAVGTFGKLDILINAAAILIVTPELVDVDERDWDLMMDTNLKGMFFCCKYAIPPMIENGGGSIVNLASQAGIRAYGRSLPYAVSKAGVIHFTAVAASQYTDKGVRVNVIAPGPIDTPQFRGSTASSEVVRQTEQSHPMGRVGTPDEIANLILFLASDEASYVSGSTFLADGGAGVYGPR